MPLGAQWYFSFNERIKLSFPCISSTHLADMHSIPWSYYWIYNHLVHLPQEACSLTQSIALSYPFMLRIKSKSHERVGENGNQCPILFGRTLIYFLSCLLSFQGIASTHMYMHTMVFLFSCISQLKWMWMLLVVNISVKVSMENGKYTSPYCSANTTSEYVRGRVSFKIYYDYPCLLIECYL